MKNDKASKAKNESIPTRLVPLSNIALQVMEDVEAIYGQPVPCHTDKSNGRILNTDTTSILLQADGLTATLLSGFKSGELILIATRSRQLSEEFLLLITNFIAIKNKRNTAIYSVNYSLIQFTRKLIGAMADIETDVGIYDGKLNEEEIMKIILVLEKLKVANIFMYPSLMIQYGWLKFSAHVLKKIFFEIDMVLVDGVQCLVDEQNRCTNTQQSLIGLKGLAEVLGVPVVALYQLDPTIENYSSTLTPFELSEIEILSSLTDGCMLMSGTRKELVFTSPKIPNSKPVAWLDQIKDFAWNNRN